MDPELYTQRRITIKHHQTMGQLKAIQNNDQLDPENESEEIAIQSLSKLKFLQKLKYTENMVIRRFLSQVEHYATVNGITSDSDKISMTLACIGQTKEGSVIIETINATDMASWSNLKSKFIRLLGHSSDFYNNYFNNFKRDEMQIGLDLSCLVQAFKRGWKIEVWF